MRDHPRTPRVFRWVPFYCEENVFHLCREPLLEGRPRAVAFISNPAGAVAMWNQRAARQPGEAILWDYHVVLLVQEPWEVWDLDTTLGLPVPAAEYLARSFHRGLPAELMPRFRVVDAAGFLETFASDRTHMRSPDGTYQSPPPPWPPIGVPDREPNLMRFVNMTEPFVGELLDLAQLSARVSDGRSGSTCMR